jgi:cephalosporin hydroxylase
MKLTIDTDRNLLIEENNGEIIEMPLYTDNSFEKVSQQWLKIGWNQKYSYTFSWLGRPIIQLPEDMLRIQEVIYAQQPDVIIETGVAHGGSLLYYASLCEMISKGKVIGVDIEIREKNRLAIESSPLSKRIQLIEADSISTTTLAQVKQSIQKNDKVLVLLDSCHTRAHVLEELNLYSPLVTSGSYIVVTDGIMKDLGDVPRGDADWTQDNPCTAVDEFLKTSDDFVMEQPKWIFNESQLTQNLTHWPNAYLRRK